MEAEPFLLSDWPEATAKVAMSTGSPESALLNDNLRRVWAFKARERVHHFLLPRPIMWWNQTCVDRFVGDHNYLQSLSQQMAYLLLKYRKDSLVLEVLGGALSCP